MSMNNKWTLGDLVFQCEKCIPCFESGKERCRGCDLDFRVFNDPDSEAEIEREALLAERIRLRDEMQLLFPLPYDPNQLTVSEVDDKLRELERMFAQVERWLDEIETVDQIAMRPKLSFLVNGLFLRYC
jgi:hypothetical protein